MFLGEDKEGGLCYQFILCGLGHKKNTRSLTVKSRLSLIFEKPIKVCRSFHIGGRLKTNATFNPLSFELANYGVVKIKISL